MNFKIFVDNFFTLLALFDALKKVQCILQELVELRYWETEQKLPRKT